MTGEEALLELLWPDEEFREATYRALRRRFPEFASAFPSTPETYAWLRAKLRELQS